MAVGELAVDSEGVCCNVCLCNMGIELVKFNLRILWSVASGYIRASARVSGCCNTPLGMLQLDDHKESQRPGLGVLQLRRE